MFRNLQIKMIFIIIALAVLMFVGYGVLSIQHLNKLQLIVSEEELISKEIEFNTLMMIIIISSFIIISGIIVFATAKSISKPIRKLIQSTKEIPVGENIPIPKIYNYEQKTDIEILTDTFNIMTNELKENLNEVTRQKKQIETILLHMTDGIIAFDMEGNIVHINPAAKSLLNLQEKELDFNTIFKKIDSEINLEKIIYLENWTTSESKINLGEKYLTIYFAPFKDENNRPAGVIALVQDITEHVKLDNMRKEFIADVSHELKTPLTSIMGYAETLSEVDYDKEIQEKFLNVITTEAIRMTKLVNDLLTLSKHDDANTKWEKIEFNLGELVKSCQEHLQIEMEKKKLKVECFVTSNVPLVYADKDGIERVVLNILSNSIKYTKEGGNIKIYVGFVYNDAYIKIIDTGIGIPEEDLNRIFDRFYRVDKARSRELRWNRTWLIYS